MIVFVPLMLISRSDDAEPKYQGRTLSGWLADIEVYSSHPDRESPSFLQTSNAVVQIGTNGLPFLMEWIQYEPSIRYRVFWQAVINVLNLLPRWAVSTSFADWAESSWRFQRAGAAGYALEVLGPDLNPVIPQLAEIAKSSRSDWSRWRAIRALRAAGPQAWDEIVDVVAATNSLGSGQALSGLDGMGTNARPALPALIHHLQSFTNYSAEVAARVLGELQLEPELTVPALTSALASPDSRLQIAAAKALAKFGERGSSALPALKRLLSKPDGYVRTAASNSVQVITAAAAAKAP